MFETTMALSLKNQLETMFNGNTYSQVLYVLLIGFIAQCVFNAISAYLFIRVKFWHVLLASLLATLLSHFIIAIIAIYTVETVYPDVFDYYLWMDLIRYFYRFELVFAIYVLPSPIYLWFYAEIFFALLFLFLVRFLVKVKAKKKKASNNASAKGAKNNEDLNYLKNKKKIFDTQQVEIK